MLRANNLVLVLASIDTQGRKQRFSCWSLFPVASQFFGVKLSAQRL